MGALKEDVIDTTGTSTTTSTAAIASAPTGILAINEGASSTTTREVTLNLSGVTSEGVLTMSVDGGDFEPLNQAKSYTLSSGDGTKTVNIILKDGNGTQSETISDSITLESTPFTVSSTTPASGSIDIKVSTTITATLVRAPDQSTVTTSSFSVTDPYGNVVPGAFSFSGNSIIFTPTTYLVNGSYMVSLTTSIKDSSANALESALSFQFAVLGTVLVKDIYPGMGDGPNSSAPQYTTDVNGTLFFSASDATNGRELWKSDGTSAGTVLVKDIYPGTSNSNPTFLTNVNGTLFFIATDGSNGRELWKSDGTSGGTVMVMDINPGGGSSGPRDLINHNGTLFFQANDGTNSREPWKSDGTTTMIKDIDVGGPSEAQFFTSFNDIVIFDATCASGGEPHRTDGTEAGTYRIKDIYEGSTQSDPIYFTVYNNAVYFRARDLQDATQHGYELWKTDGLEAGTVLAHDLRSGTGNSSPGYLTVSNGILFFTAYDPTNGTELRRLNN
ncbi:ELWxxDGT repeat protein [Candidatus Riflebacteria bacterium]